MWPHRHPRCAVCVLPGVLISDLHSLFPECELSVVGVRPRSHSLIHWERRQLCCGFRSNTLDV